MAFDPSNPALGFLGTSLGLYRTPDNGGSWTPVALQAGVSVLPLQARALPPLRLYTGGNAPPGGATLFKSDDGAASWTPVSFPGSGSTLERSMVVLSGTASDTVFIGMGSGVLRYIEPEVVAVPHPAHPDLELHVHPNPAGATTAIAFFLPKRMNVSLRVLDTGGREVASLLSGDYGAGPWKIRWQSSWLPSGIYYCRLVAGSAVVIRKVVVMR
jgi:hypothetical protein